MTTFEIHAWFPHTYTDAKGKRAAEGETKGAKPAPAPAAWVSLPFSSSSTVRKSGVFNVVCVLCLVFLAGSQLLCLDFEEKKEERLILGELDLRVTVTEDKSFWRQSPDSPDSPTCCPLLRTSAR